MIDWMRRLFGTPREEALRGVPASRRQKTYSSMGGYVFQYVYLGYRLEVSPAGKDYVFKVESQRTPATPLRIRISQTTLEQIEQRHGRDLTGREQYALAKLKLFRVLDELAPQPGGAFRLGQTFELGAEAALGLWELLDL